MAKQPADLDSLGTALFCAREMAEELDEVVVLYFIEMAIAEAKVKIHRPQTITNPEPVTNLEFHERKMICRTGLERLHGLVLD